MAHSMPWQERENKEEEEENQARQWKERKASKEQSLQVQGACNV